MTFKPEAEGLMDSSAAHPVSLSALAGSLWRHRGLIGQMTRREIIGRYKGSMLGLLWSFFNPLLMLVVYTFVFAVVFKARWAGAEESKAQFAVVLFAGMIVHGVLAEVVNRAPSLVLGHPNFVKKVVFPLEILPVVTLGAALFHGAMSLLVLLAACVFFNGSVYPTAAYLPLVLVPLVLCVLGLAWFLASLGTYLRDVSQVVSIVTTILLFTSPVFYPVSALPPQYQTVMLANPLTFIIEQARNVLIWGHAPDWAGLGVYSAVAGFLCWAGFAWFQSTRRGFADVL